MMMDTRIYERLARELIQFNSKLTFRFLMKNGHLIERVISEVSHLDDSSIIYYSDYRYEYIPKKGYNEKDIMKIDMKKMQHTGRQVNPTLSTENGTIYHTVEMLLKSGYILVKD